MSDIDDIIARIDPEGMRRALDEKRQHYQRGLETLVATYSIVRDLPDNPIATDEERDARKKELEKLENDMRNFAWAIDEVDRRLTEASAALNGQPNRAARRAAKKK